ncbi:hypothetical protein Plhal304r1_c033g0104161 [Plasmopara halstedii]
MKVIVGGYLAKEATLVNKDNIKLVTSRQRLWTAPTQSQSWEDVRDDVRAMTQG